MARINSLIDKDPWGLSFKIMFNKLIRRASQMTELMNIETLNMTLESLFPRGETHDPVDVWRDWQGPLKDFEVSSTEVIDAINRRNKRGSPAPDPNGLTTVVWKRITPTMAERLANV